MVRVVESPPHRTAGLEPFVPVLLLALTGICLVVGTALHLAGAGSAGNLAWIVSGVLGAIFAAWSVIDSLRHRRLGVDVIALLALIGALVVGEYLAAAVISLMVSSGRTLEGWASGRAHRDLQALLERAPRTAHRYSGNALESVALDEVVPGDLVFVASGELVPVDGTLVGEAVLDESALTGEALPVERQAGELPADEEALRALPGIGPYTAAAVAAIAFGARTFALDGNGARVAARLWGVHDSIDVPATREALRARGLAEVPAARAGDFNQAVMELGATVCTPRAPKCGVCPLSSKCRAHATGAAARLPVRTPKRKKVVVRVACCACVDGAGRVLLVRRQAGLLAGTWALPTVELDGEDAGDAARAAVREVGVRAGRLVARGAVRHVFTHRDVTAEVFRVRAAARRVRDGQGARRWLAPDELASVGVSSFTQKTLRVALGPHPAPDGAGLSLGSARRR